MRLFVFTKVLQALGLLAAAFVLLRVVGPWLVDLHNTAALILAAVLLTIGVLLLGWFAWSLVVSIRRGDRSNA